MPGDDGHAELRINWNEVEEREAIDADLNGDAVGARRMTAQSFSEAPVMPPSPLWPRLDTQGRCALRFQTSVSIDLSMVPAPRSEPRPSGGRKSQSLRPGGLAFFARLVLGCDENSVCPGSSSRLHSLTKSAEQRNKDLQNKTVDSGLTMAADLDA